MSLYEHLPHPHIERRKDQGPVRVADQLPTGNVITRFNTRLATVITKMVGTMWCAYAFAAFDMVSLPDAIHAGTASIISWVAQTFLQLVLLSIIMVGQNISAAAADARADQTYKDAEAVLAEALKIQEHLAVQDALLERLAGHENTSTVPPAG